MKRSIYLIGTLLAAALTIAATPEKDNEKVKVTVVHYADGLATVMDTTFDASSGYTVEQFLINNKLDPTETAIIDTEAFDGKYTLDDDNSILFMRGDEGNRKMEVRVRELDESEMSEIEIEEIISGALEDLDNVISDEIRQRKDGLNQEVIVIRADEDGGRRVITKSITRNGEQEEVKIEEVADGEVVFIEGDEVDVKEIRRKTEEILKAEGIHLEELMKEAGQENVVIKIKKNSEAEGDEETEQKKVIIYENEWFDENGIAEEVLETEYTIAVVTRTEGDGEEANPSEFTADQAQLPIEGPSFYPNPSKGMFRLEFFLPERGQTQIEIFDLQGRQVYSENLGNYQGAYKNDIDVSSLGRGTYLLNITQNNLRLAEKIIVN